MAVADKSNSGLDELKANFQDVVKALGEKAIGGVGDRVSGMTDKLTDMAEGGPVGKAATEGAKAKASGDSAVGGALKGGLSGIKDKAKDLIPGMGGGGGGGGKATKSTNIVESIDVGVPLSVAYNAWTEFGSFPSFMKKVESAQAEEDNKISFKAQIFLSHRSWEATIQQQIPDECIVWRSKGEKGHVDGAVTFHELGPNLTRILVVLEYYPQGLFEKTGNIWEAQGRRARAEIRHFRRHVMVHTILDPDAVEGWRGRIEDGEVVETHEEALDREEQEDQEREDQEPEDQEPDDETAEDEEPGDEFEDEPAEDEEPEDEFEDEPAEDEEPEDEFEDEPAEDEEPEDEYEDEPAEDEEPEDEYEDEPAEDEEPEDEYEDEPAEDEEPEDEYEDEPADDEEPEDERPRRRRRAS